MITPLSSAELATSMQNDQAARAADLTAQGILPSLVILDSIRPDGHEEVNAYVNGKLNYLKKVGINPVHQVVSGYAMEDTVRANNLNRGVHGILVEDPPYFEGLDMRVPLDRSLVNVLRTAYLDAIAPKKAVDGQGKWSAHPTGATAEAAVRLLSRYRRLDEEHVLIVGEGTVGRGIAKLVQNECRELSVVDVRHRNLDTLPALARSATSVFVATGVARSFGPELVRSGHAIVGIGRSDIDPRVRQIADKDFALTPQVGGVGPLTIRTIAERVLDAAEARLPEAA